VIKKAKAPVSQPTIMASDSNPVNQETSSIVQTVMEQISEQLKTTIADHVQVSVTAMANSVAAIITASLSDRISNVELENKNLRDQITSLSDKIKILESEKTAVDDRLDEAEQYSRRSCLRISGIPETPEENTDDLIIKLAQACGTQLTLSDIDRSHRVRPKHTRSSSTSRPNVIIVKFVSYRSRSSFLRGKSKLKESADYRGVFINEDLTRQRADLLHNARLLVKNKTILSAWSYDGRIFIKHLDGIRRVVTSKDDIANIQ